MSAQSIVLGGYGASVTPGRQAAIRVLLVLGVSTACLSTSPPEATTIASASTTTGPIDPLETASPILTTSPTQPPTHPPTQPPTASPTLASAPPLWTAPPASEVPDAKSPFRLVDGIGDRHAVSSVTAGGPGYVAVGWRWSVDEGRVWTSVDGRTWVRQPNDITNGYLEEIVEFNGVLYAFGHESGAFTGVGPGTVWRSSDGVSWTQTASISQAGAHWRDVLATDDGLIAFETGDGFGEVWLSSDGTSWRRPKGLSDGRYFGAALGQTVVAAGRTNDNHIGFAPIVSRDGGATWEDVVVGPDYEIDPRLAANNGTIVAATSACCSLPGVAVGLPYRTTDGLKWSFVDEPLALPAAEVVSVPGGFLALSNDGSTALSADGERWFLGPRMPEQEEERAIRAAASGEAGVFMVTSDSRNAYEYDVHLWFAPIDAFEMSRWTIPVPVAEQPQVGFAYPADIGYCPYSIRMGGQVWLPSTGGSLDGQTTEERGTVWLVDAQHALYKTPDGTVIPLEPVHPVPADPDPGC